MKRASTRDSAPRKVLVVGIGNPDRGDDGVGAVVVRKSLPDGCPPMWRSSCAAATCCR